MENQYQTKVVTADILQQETTMPSSEKDSIQPDNEKEERMNSEIEKVRDSFVFTNRGARLRFATKAQAEIQWRLCNP